MRALGGQQIVNVAIDVGAGNRVIWACPISYARGEHSMPNDGSMAVLHERGFACAGQ